MRTCPECYTELKAVNRQGVEIDFCPQCRGIWLDHGELEKLLERSSHVPYQQYQSYQAPPGYQQGHQPDYAQQHHQSHGQHHQPSYGHQSQGHQSHYNQGHYDPHYKKHKKYKHHHPVSDFLEDVFDIFGD